jgi:hypothetical protein
MHRIRRVLALLILPVLLATPAVGSSRVTSTLAALGQTKQIDVSIPDGAPVAGDKLQAQPISVEGTPGEQPDSGNAAAAGQHAGPASAGQKGQPGEAPTMPSAPPLKPAPEPTPESYAAGQKLMAEVVKAHGGAALESLQNISITVEGTLDLGGRSMPMSGRSVFRLPDCEFEDSNLPMGDYVRCSCMGLGWSVSTGGPPENMSQGAVEQMTKDRRANWWWILRYPENYKIQALPDEEQINGTPVQVVQIRQDVHDNWRFYFDARTHLLLRSEFRDPPATGGVPMVKQEDYTDYKDADGIQWPFTRTQLMNGVPFVTLKTTSISVNAGVPDSTFAMPK